MHKQHILIYEQDPALATLYTTQLDRCGYIGHRAHTLPEIHSLAQMFPIQLVIANMPSDQHKLSDLLSYYGLLKDMGTRMVIVSGNEHNQLLCNSLGIPFYPKPLTTDILRTLVMDIPSYRTDQSVIA